MSIEASFVYCLAPPMARSRNSRLTSLLTAFGTIVWSACGDDASPEPAPTSVIQLVPGVPTPVSENPASESFVLPSNATALAAVGSTIFAGTTTGAVVFSSDGLSVLPVFDAPPSGRIRAIVPERDGVVLAAEGGLYFTTGSSLADWAGSESLAELGVRELRRRYADADGDGQPDRHFALATDAGPFELFGQDLVAWSIPEQSGAPRAVFARQDDLFVAYGSPGVYRIDKIASEAELLELGAAVQDIACDGASCDAESTIYFATDLGLFARDAAGSITHYTLAAEGDAGQATAGFALDRVRQRVYILTADSLLVAQGGSVPRQVASLPPSNLPRWATVDAQGDVWVASGTDLTHWLVGEPLSFAKDVRPVMTDHCARCHAQGIEGAPTIDFEDYDVAAARLDRIVARMQEGTMPPSSEPNVPVDQLQVVVDWSKNPNP